MSQQSRGLNGRQSEQSHLTEERVIQRYRLYAPHIEVIQQIRVQIEEDGHVDRLPGIEPLLLEAEALDLAEVRRALGGRDAVRGDADDVLVAVVGRLVEGQRRLARVDVHLALLGHELPGQHVGDGGVERDLDALACGDGDEAAGDVAVGIGAAVGADWLATPACGLADL